MPQTTFLNLPEDKRKRITDAALKEFAQKGYQQGSMQAISQRAGVAKGSMYQYFTNKKELFYYIFDQVIEEKIEFVRDTLETNRVLPFFEQLEALFLASQEYAKEHPYPYNLYLKIKEEVPVEIREVLAARLETAGPGIHYAALVQDAVDSGEIRAGMDAEFAAFVVYTLLQEFSTYLASVLGTSSLEENRKQAKKFIDFLKNGLKVEIVDVGRGF